MVAVTLLVSGSWHIMQSHARDSVRYAPRSALGQGDPDCARPAVLAAACARHARRALPAAPILCADTTVAIGRQILGKPADAAQARQMLQRLSGRSHRVLTAIALHDGQRSHHALQVSQVRFAPLDEALIERYIASGEPFGKAGAYAVQSALAGWISRIDGSYSGVMGLPLHETAQMLGQASVQMALAW